MNEVMETIYQWHEGRKIQQISRSLGIDRKTVRKYLGLLNELTIGRGDPLPDEHVQSGHLEHPIRFYPNGFSAVLSLPLLLCKSVRPSVKVECIFRMDSSPGFSMILCALWMTLSHMASARVGSPMMSCQVSMGNWVVMMVERAPYLSSMISRMSIIPAETRFPPVSRGLGRKHLQEFRQNLLAYLLVQGAEFPHESGPVYRS